MALIAGENILEKTYLFHGRVGRWVRHLDMFSQESTFNQYFGGIGSKYPYLMEHGPHNDYLRILFSTGYIGLILFVIFLLSLSLFSLKLKREHSYMLLSLVLLIALYSITLTPTTYIDVIILFMAVVVFNVKKISYY